MRTESPGWLCPLYSGGRVSAEVLAIPRTVLSGRPGCAWGSGPAGGVAATPASVLGDTGSRHDEAQACCSSALRLRQVQAPHLGSREGLWSRGLRGPRDVESPGPPQGRHSPPPRMMRHSGQRERFVIVTYGVGEPNPVALTFAPRCP